MMLNVNPKGPKFQAVGDSGSIEIHFVDHEDSFDSVVTGSGSGFRLFISPGPVACMPTRGMLESNGVVSHMEIPFEVSRAYTEICEDFCEGELAAPGAVDRILAWAYSETSRFPYV